VLGLNLLLTMTLLTVNQKSLTSFFGVIFYRCCDCMQDDKPSRDEKVETDDEDKMPDYDEATQLLVAGTCDSWVHIHRYCLKIYRILWNT